MFLLSAIVNDGVMDRIIFMLLVHLTALNLELIRDLLSIDVEAAMKRTHHLCRHTAGKKEGGCNRKCCLNRKNRKDFEWRLRGLADGVVANNPHFFPQIILPLPVGASPTFRWDEIVLVESSDTEPQV